MKNSPRTRNSRSVAKTPESVHHPGRTSSTSSPNKAWNRTNAKTAKDAKVNEPNERADKAAKAIGCAIEVHRELGFFEWLEAALWLEMISRGITFVRQPIVDVSYKGSPVGQNRLDFLVDGCLIVELKAVGATSIRTSIGAERSRI